MDESDGVQNQAPNLTSNGVKDSKGKSCKGCLYYSSLQKSKSKTPTCIGLSKTLDQGTSPISLCFFHASLQIEFDQWVNGSESYSFSFFIIWVLITFLFCYVLLYIVVFYLLFWVLQWSLLETQGAWCYFPTCIDSPVFGVFSMTMVVVHNSMKQENGNSEDLKCKLKGFFSFHDYSKDCQ